MNRRGGLREATYGHPRRVFHVVFSRIAVCSDRRRQRAWQPLEIAYKVALPARLGALREPAVLLDGLPLLRNEIERRCAILDCPGLNKPAANDDTRAANTTTAVHGRNAPAARVVPEDVEDLAYVRLGAWETPIWDRKGVVLDVT